jgi:hypothetical protein
MSVQATLDKVADEFLASTDTTYDECASGIFTLDRIIVGTPSILTADARGYFVPILYAYWERFFRITFNEYLRCISITKFKVDELRLELAVLRIGRELSDISAQHKFKQINELCQNRTISDVKSMLRQLLTKIEGPVEYPPTHDFVKTYSNVEYTTLEDNCKRFGIDVAALKANFMTKSLYVSLKDLVDARNDIAHGSAFRALKAEEWNETKDFVLKIMQIVQIELYESLRDQTKVLDAVATGYDFSI